MKEFDFLLQKDPTPGAKNRVSRNLDGSFILPRWVFDSPTDIVVGCKSANRKFASVGLTSQIVYDILVLGLTSPLDRPVCPVCGQPLKFIRFSNGYSATCGKESCSRESIKRSVTSLWRDSAYRETQVNSHIEWAKKEENLEKMRQISLMTWQDQDYRDRQIKAHKDWSNVKENRELLRQRSLDAWNSEEYRKRQSEAHKKYCINNPEKVYNRGVNGVVTCSKAILGSLRYDSSWERYLIEVMDSMDEVVSVERASFWIPYTCGDEQFNYFPDLIVKFVNGVNILVEIKANWMIESDEKTTCKLRAGELYVSEHLEIFDKYVILKDEDLCDSPHYVKFNSSLARMSLLKYITL